MSGFSGSQRYKAWLLGLVIGLSSALLGMTPYASLLEEKMGLGLLFFLRGEQSSPQSLVIVDIDPDSANLLSPSDNQGQWPRRLHAQLVRRLHEAGAELIGFNVFFSTPQPQDDDALASAMREAGDVVLASYLKLKHLQGDVYVESLEEPPAPLAQSALATAPFLLAQGEETDRFMTHFGENVSRPTFPVVMLRLFVLKNFRAELGQLLGQADLPFSSMEGQDPARAASVLADVENRLASDPQGWPRLLQALSTLSMQPGPRAALSSLIETLEPTKPCYFNHYGAAGAIRRISYRQVLEPEPGAAPLDLRGKVVLVGFTEDFLTDDAENHYFTAYSAVSSLELAATALSNMLAHEAIHALLSPAAQFLMMFCWGLLVGLLSASRLRVGFLSIMLLTCGYAALALWLFTARWLWIPVILPLLGVVPMGMVACLLENYLERTRQHKRIHSVVSRFIPDEATSHDAAPEDDENWESKLTFGVCLATDAGQYTSLAETMEPMALGELMNDYYSSMFPLVRQNGGWVSDVIGDAMMAIWTVPNRQIDVRLGALRAALEILAAVDVFQAKRRVRLPIRMGLQGGELRVGFVGGKEHGAYRAVGDTVNTSARLEGLNKLLGTRILVSESLVQGLSGFVTRPMGRFMLAGKTHAVAVHELLTTVETVRAEQLEMIECFGAALGQFNEGQWQAAFDAFVELSKRFPDDGPTAFYMATARTNADNPLATPELAAIHVNKPQPGALAES